MGVNEEQGREFSCRHDAFRACFPLAVSMSKKRDLLPNLVPVCVPVLATWGIRRDN